MFFVFVYVGFLMFGVTDAVPVVFFAGQSYRVHMHRGVGQVFQVVEQLVVHILGDVMTGGDR